MNYAKIENGEVIKDQSCPKNIKLVSNFYLMSDIEKIQYGWYPIEEIRPTLSYGESLNNFTYDIQTTKVVKTFTKINVDIEELRAKKIDDLNQSAKNVIGSEYDTETLLYISLGIYGDAKKIEARDYIQNIQTKIINYKNQINDAITINDLNFDFDFIIV